jgi:gluconate kinase
MRKVVFVVGNYGVGKSSMLHRPILERDDIFLRTSERYWVLGTDICGADSLSMYKKQEVMNKIKEAKQEGLLIAGSRYCQQKDIKELSRDNEVHLVYLKTSYMNNAARIAGRGKHINIDTYNQKLKEHISLMNKCRRYCKIYMIDNNRPLQEVKAEFDNIIQDL